MRLKYEPSSEPGCVGRMLHLTTSRAWDQWVAHVAQAQHHFAVTGKIPLSDLSSLRLSYYHA